MEVLRLQLEMAAGGMPRVVWVDGEPGVGKTTLVRAFLRPASHRAVWVSGDEAEASLPYGLLTALHRGITAAVGSAALGEGALSEATDPLMAGAELLVALGASDDPLVLVVDDFQWADQRSASALRFALRRLVAEPLLVVLITRPHPGDTLGEAWARLLSDTEFTARLHLEGLTTEGIAELLALTGHGRVTPAVAERLREHTNGNPLHARALVDELGESALRARGVLPAPRSFAQLTIARMARLGSDAGQLVTAGAVLGASFPLDLAATIGGVADPIAALDVAVAAGLLEPTSEGDVRFPHPLVRGAVYNDIPPAHRRALHLAAAAATVGARSLEHRVASSAGWDDVLADELESLAREELRSGAASAAHDRLVAAARLSSDVRHRDRRVLKAVEVLMSVGEFEQADAMHEMVMGCAESAHRSYVLGLLTPGVEAEAHFSAATAGAGDAEIDESQLRRKAIAGLAVAHLRQERFEEALRDATTAAGPGRPGRGPGLMGWVQVVCLAQLDRMAEAREVLDHRVAPGTDASGLGPDELCLLGMVEMIDDDLPAAAADLTAMIEQARAGEACRMTPLGLALLAHVQYRLGRWDESVVNSELASGFTSRRGYFGLAHTVAAFVHAGRGSFDLADAHVREACDVERSLLAPATRYYVAMARAVLAQARGDLVELRAATEPLLDGSIVATVEGLDRWGWQVLAIEGLLGTGEIPAARERLADLVELVEGSRLWSARPDLARLEGQLAEASGDAEAALGAYAVGLQPAEAGLPLPLSAARLGVAYGSLLRRTGARREAIDQLRAAHAGLTTLRAAPFLVACEAELAACGLRAPAAEPAGALALTSSEQAVAHLIAQGLTNREAAARLYVSPKTIDYHLGHIYAKLGITSRRELSRRLRTSKD